MLGTVQLVVQKRKYSYNTSLFCILRSTENTSVDIWRMKRLRVFEPLNLDTESA